MEPRHLITMSLGKIQSCRGKRGGPSLHKSLMVSAILHKARNILMNDIYIQARKAELLEEERQRMMAQRQENAEISEVIEPPRPDTPLPTEYITSHATPDAKKTRHENTCDKENTPPTPPCIVSTDAETEAKDSESVELSNMEYRETNESNKCAKRRLSECSDSENIPPKRVRTDNPATESTDNNTASSGQECSQQISCLVQRFNSGLNGLFNAQKCNSSPLQDSQGHNDVVSNCCATQLGKDAAFSEQMNRPIALTV